MVKASLYVCGHCCDVVTRCSFPDFDFVNILTEELSLFNMLEDIGLDRTRLYKKD